jgi:hypothetical protein
MLFAFYVNSGCDIFDRKQLILLGLPGWTGWPFLTTLTLYVHHYSFWGALKRAKMINWMLLFSQSVSTCQIECFYLATLTLTAGSSYVTKSSQSAKGVFIITVFGVL